MDEPKALLICADLAAVQELRQILQDLSIQTWSAATCDAAEAVILHHQPHLVFVDTSLWDRNQEQFVQLTNQSVLPLNLIVVGTVTDIDTYAAALRSGAFNFIGPPYSRVTLGITLRAAVIDVRERREALTQPTAAHMSR